MPSATRRSHAASAGGKGRRASGYVHSCSWGRSCTPVTGRPGIKAEPALPWHAGPGGRSRPCHSLSVWVLCVMETETSPLSAVVKVRELECRCPAQATHAVGAQRMLLPPHRPGLLEGAHVFAERRLGHTSHRHLRRGRGFRGWWHGWLQQVTEGARAGAARPERSQWVGGGGTSAPRQVGS